MKKMTDEFFEKISDQIRKNAEELRKNAAYSGEWGDGGATELLNNLMYYDLGRKQLIPPTWESYLIKSDPEYDEYLRLKQKFSDYSDKIT